jgi:LPPG:FO 2-phospho-L-lactate transferase
MKVVELSGGVGGARMARGLHAVEDVDLTVIVNVGDDADNHGLVVCPDLDTVLYTLAGVEGQYGWGRRDDTFRTNDELARFGVENTFRIGDLDLALKLVRTERMARGETLSSVTRSLANSFDVRCSLLPATDDRLRTEIEVADGGWISFQEYFVDRRHRDDVLGLRFAGSEDARPAPGVVESIETADVVVIAPSNPPLSIWPVLAIGSLEKVVADHPRVVAVSPLIGGKTVKGPADRVMLSLGLSPGNQGVVEAYDGVIDLLVINSQDSDEPLDGVEVLATDTLIGDRAASKRLAREILGS